MTTGITGAELLSLAERVESAAPNDREIELAVWRMLDPTHAASVEAEGKTPLPWLHRYSTSIDAALTLVPDNHRLRIQVNEDGRACAWLWLPGDDATDRWGKLLANPATAITAACLRALAEQS